MTKEQLEQARFLGREEEHGARRLRAIARELELYAAARGNPEADALCAALEAEARELRERCARQHAGLLAAQRFIDAVPDGAVRLILKLRYLEGATWLQIAARLGYRVSADALRMRARRFLRAMDGGMDGRKEDRGERTA